MYHVTFVELFHWQGCCVACYLQWISLGLFGVAKHFFPFSKCKPSIIHTEMPGELPIELCLNLFACIQFSQLTQLCASQQDSEHGQYGRTGAHVDWIFSVCCVQACCSGVFYGVPTRSQEFWYTGSNHQSLVSRNKHCDWAEWSSGKALFGGSCNETRRIRWWYVTVVYIYIYMRELCRYALGLTYPLYCFRLHGMADPAIKDSSVTIMEIWKRCRTNHELSHDESVVHTQWSHCRIGREMCTHHPSSLPRLVSWYSVWHWQSAVSSSRFYKDTKEEQEKWLK